MSEADARVTEGLVYADRSERGKLRFTGEQRAWFLHQIVTQHFDPLAPGETRDAAMLKVNGRMIGYLEGVATDDEILVHFEPELLATWPEEIGRFVFATRVEIDDVTEEMGLVLVAGEGWEEAAAKVRGAVIHPTHGLGVPAAYFWVKHQDVTATVASLVASGAREAPEEELEGIRIRSRRPRWGRDMDFKTIPQEARIEDVAVDFHKGCYVGQEAVAKIFFRGKVNRLLRLVEFDAPVEVEAEVSADGKKVGSVTSASGIAALAMLRRTVEPGDGVEANETYGKVID